MFRGHGQSNEVKSTVPKQALVFSRRQSNDTLTVSFAQQQVFLIYPAQKKKARRTLSTSFSCCSRDYWSKKDIYTTTLEAPKLEG